jgi:hypothetical protein
MTPLQTLFPGHAEINKHAARCRLKQSDRRKNWRAQHFEHVSAPLQSQKDLQGKMGYFGLEEPELARTR